MIDLTPFCGKDDDRWYLNAPFSEGEFTYATNGHILIRVARRDDITSEPEQMMNRCAKLFAEAAPTPPIAIPEIPPIVEGDCDCCNGAGSHERECGTGDYDCDDCAGTGRVMKEPGDSWYPQIDVGDAAFAPNYLRLIKSLPNVQFMPNGQHGAHFTFDGGDGLLMPIKKE